MGPLLLKLLRMHHEAAMTTPPAAPSSLLRDDDLDADLDGLLDSDLAVPSTSTSSAVSASSSSSASASATASSSSSSAALSAPSPLASCLGTTCPPALELLEVDGPHLTRQARDRLLHVMRVAPEKRHAQLQRQIASDADKVAAAVEEWRSRPWDDDNNCSIESEVC